MGEKVKLSDFPVEKDYPYEEELWSDVMKQFLCIPKDNVDGKKKVVSCNKTRITQTETYYVKDRQEFKKLYCTCFDTAFNLSGTATKVLLYILYAIDKKPRMVDITPKLCMDKCGFKTLKSVRDGVVELLKKNIIAKTPYPSKYWLNPVVIFNGDRVEFVREYILDEKQTEQ